MKKDWIACVTSSSTLDQLLWKKVALYPSAPGTLLGSNWKAASLISPAWIGLYNQLDASTDNLLLTVGLGKIDQ